MLKADEKIDAEAIDWVIRLRDAHADEWAAFTQWLESDPAHLAAYEDAALAIADAEALPRPLPPAGPAWEPEEAKLSARFGRRVFIGWGVAASLALGAGWSLLPADAPLSTVQTASAERRTVTLADGSSIILNGGTKIVLDEDRPRFAKLEQGEALFQVVHDPNRPFEVETPGGLLRDMGTVFNVVHDSRGLEVAVAEGAVLYNPGREAKNLMPGMALRKSPGLPLWVGRTDGAAIGSWREGRLVYSAAPLSKIAADLSRNLGITVAAAKGVEDRPFSGVISLEGPPPQVLERTAALLGLRVSQAGSTWTFATGSGARS